MGQHASADPQGPLQAGLVDLCLNHSGAEVFVDSKGVLLLLLCVVWRLLSVVHASWVVCWCQLQTCSVAPTQLLHGS